MTTLLAIDPGADTGIALFFIGPDCQPVLVNANVVSPDDVAWARFMPDIVIIETPRIYPHSRARPNDILKLARIVGRYQERFKGARGIRLVEPHEWKGSVDGDIMTKRIESALTPSEMGITKGLPKSTAHNAVDAIGLGKWSFRQAWMRGQL
jgi:hypothetical protein